MKVILDEIIFKIMKNKAGELSVKKPKMKALYISLIRKALEKKS